MENAKTNNNPPKMHQHTCLGCKVEFSRRSNKSKYCSNKCKSAWSRKLAMGEINCKTCNNRFQPTPDTYMDYCSDDCKLFAKRLEWVSNNVKRQAITNAIPVRERVNVAEIFARDNNTCQICGIQTSRENGKYSHEYPTIDHIIPISKGGHHVASNLQCACLRCNMSKGSKLEYGKTGTS